MAGFEVQTFSVSQHGVKARENEDSIVVVDDKTRLVAAVFDGASSIASVLGKGSAISGFVSARLASGGVRENFLIALASDVRDLALRVNREIAFRQNLDPSNVDPMTVSQASGTIAFVNFSSGKLQVAQVGESIGVVVYVDGRVERALPEDPEPFDIPAIKLARKLGQEQGLTLRQALSDQHIAISVENLMIASRSSDNLPDGRGCGVFNGSIHLEEYIRIREWSLSEITQVLLLTDGLWLPTTEFHSEPDWEEIVREVGQNGLEGLYRRVTDLKNSDPEFERFPRWKAHDDASGIVIEL